MYFLIYLFIYLTPFHFRFLHPFHSIQITLQEIPVTLIKKGGIVLSYANVKEFVSWNVIPLMRWSFIFYMFSHSCIVSFAAVISPVAPPH